jgi:hypothetical protein
MQTQWFDFMARMRSCLFETQASRHHGERDGQALMASNILLGALVSFLNFGIHAIMTGVVIGLTRYASTRADRLGVFGRMTTFLFIAVSVIMVAHGIEVGVWAIFYEWNGVLPNAKISMFEFAFENYTALGYGEPVPADGHRLIGPITSLNGLLLVGWSVAIIFEVMRMAEIQIGHHKPETLAARRGKKK